MWGIKSPVSKLKNCHAKSKTTHACRHVSQNIFNQPGLRSFLATHLRGTERLQAAAIHTGKEKRQAKQRGGNGQKSNTSAEPVPKTESRRIRPGLPEDSVARAARNPARKTGNEGGRKLCGQCE